MTLQPHGPGLLISFLLTCRGSTFQKIVLYISLLVRTLLPYRTKPLIKDNVIKNLGIFSKSSLGICFTDFGGRGERERERNINTSEKLRFVASCVCPNWGSNLHLSTCPPSPEIKPLGVQGHAPTY